MDYPRSVDGPGRQRLLLITGGAAGLAFAALRGVAWIMPDNVAAPWALCALALSIFAPAYVTFSAHLDRDPLEAGEPPKPKRELGMVVSVCLALAWGQALLRYAMQGDPPFWLKLMQREFVPWNIAILIPIAAFTGRGATLLRALGLAAGAMACLSMTVSGVLRTQIEAVAVGLGALWVAGAGVFMCLYKTDEAT
ncbi:MAG: hypothetical protein R3B07_15285 [Polyangiaceae bacterium]